MNENGILKELYSREKELNTQLDATRHAIIGFGGKLVKLGNVSKIDATPTSTIIKVERDVPPVNSMRDRIKRYRSDTEKYVIEILTDEKHPMKADEVLNSINDLGIKYSLNSMRALLPSLANANFIKRVDKGLYSHINYKKPESLINKVITIRDINDYFKLRKEVTRKELMTHFVNGGRLTENMVQSRIEKLIKNGKVIRKEHGVYRLKKQ